MMRDDDHELRARFDALRPARARAAGDYAATAATAHARHAAARAWRRRHGRLALASAVPVLGALAVYAAARMQPETFTSDPAVQALVEWQSPTDALLHNAYADWLRTVPSLHHSAAMTAVFTEGGPP